MTKNKREAVDEPPLMSWNTLHAAASYLGTTPDNLRAAIARGSLEATKFGRDWAVTREAIERYRVNHRRRT